jgi:hypothetical protein
MSKLDGDPAKIVPDAGENALDFIVRFVGKRGVQLIAADAVFRKQRTDPAHEGAGKICHAASVGMFDAIEQANRNRADSFVEQRLERPIGHYSMIPKMDSGLPFRRDFISL